MELNPKILVVSSDLKLVPELEAAIAVLHNVRAVIYTAPDHRRGMDAVRNRRPDIVMVEMSRDMQELKLFVEEVVLSSPETHVVAVYSQQTGNEEPGGGLIVEAVRAGVQDFLARPLSSTELDRFLDRIFRQAPALDHKPVGRIITFFSNKGGVGKSTVSTNVACGLAQRYPHRVLLVDASLQLGVCAALLDIKPKTTLTDAVRERDRLDETLLRELAIGHECGLDLLAAPLSAVDAAGVDDEVISLVLTLARRSYDYVIVDTFPVLDRTMMAVLDLTDIAYLVTESVVPTIVGAVRLLALLNELGFPADRRKLVLNRYSNFEGNLKAEVVAEQVGQKIDHILPYQRRLLVAQNLGKPYILNSPTWYGFGKAIRPIIDEVASLKPSVQSATRAGRMRIAANRLTGAEAPRD